MNAGSIILGGIVGLFVGKKIKDHYQQSINKALGIAVMILGLNGVITSMITGDKNGVLSSSGELLLIISLILGVFVGEILRIDERLNHLSSVVEKKFKLTGFSSSFMNGTLIYCVGAMAIVGALNDGIRNDASVLLVKSLLDGISSIVLAATLGPGVIFSALPVFLYQGAISLLAGLLESYLSAQLLAQICAVGYCLVLCIGMNFVFDSKIKTANMLPALLVPIIWSGIQIFL